MAASMAKHLFVEARGGVLHPADPWSAEEIDVMKPGKTFRVDMVADRKRGTLRHWWAGLAYMVERWKGLGDPRADMYPSSRKLNEAVLVYLGYRETWYHLDGSMQFRPDSIRFEAMDEDEFSGVMEAARVMALQLWGMDPWQEWADANEREGGYNRRWK